LFLLSIFSVFSLKGQAQFLQDIAGVPLTTVNYENVKGTPFLVNEWSSGMVKLANGNTYKDNLFLKYNIKEDQLYFKGKNDETLEFVDPVKEFVINYKQEAQHYRNGYSFINGFSDKSFFEVLSDGSVQLLKKPTKVILESKQYNSAAVDKSFEDVYQYYIVKQGAAIQIKRDKKSVFTALGDKQTELDEFTKTNKLNLKNDSDLAKLVTYYNSL